MIAIQDMNSTDCQRIGRSGRNIGIPISIKIIDEDDGLHRHQQISFFRYKNAHNHCSLSTKPFRHCVITVAQQLQGIRGFNCCEHFFFALLAAAISMDPSTTSASSGEDCIYDRNKCWRISSRKRKRTTKSEFIPTRPR